MPGAGPPHRPRSLVWLYSLSAAAAFCLTAVDVGISPLQLRGAMADIVDYLGRYLHPDFQDWRSYLADMGRTMAMAVWGTALAVIGAVAMGPLAAQNLSPNAPLHRLARETLSFLRAMPDLLIALVLVGLLGLGPLPGILALALHTTGFLGKFCADSLERVGPGVHEALDACGATTGQKLMFAGWPSIVREFTGYALYILDRNARMACALGVVGAGGIGVALQQAVRVFEYRQASAIILVVLVTIIAIDYASTWLRGRLM